MLVAISIPIFTSQLKKARLATNQANARAAYASSVSAYLTNNKDVAATYKYDTATATVTEESVATDAKAAPSPDIAAWTVDNSDLTAKTYTNWYVAISDAGTVTGYSFK